MKISLIIIVTLLSFSNIYAAPPSQWDIYVQTQPALAKYTGELVILQTKKAELNQGLVEKHLQKIDQNRFKPYQKKSLALIEMERKLLERNYQICLQEIKIRQDILDKCYINYLKTHPQTNSILNDETNLKRKQK
jgi:hypothetical protein